MEWAWDQQAQLYARLAAYIVTAVGLSLAYSIMGGIIQGGGMDPYFYVWNSLFLTGPGMGHGGIALCLWEAEVRVHAQCVVDDTTLWGDTQEGMRDSVHKCLHVFRGMNAACNPTKFGLLHYVHEGNRIRPWDTTLMVEGAKVRAASKSKYVKFLGGNANVLSTAQEDVKKIREHARLITAQLCRNVPSLAITLAILGGCILDRWLYNRSVGWPAGVEHAQHEGECRVVLGVMCNAARRALYLPLKTPKTFFIHPKGIAMATPLHKFWENTMMDLYKTANARHQWVRETTQRAIIHPWSGMGTLRGVDTDYDKLYRWCREHQWKPGVHHEGGHTDTWRCNIDLGRVHDGVLVVVGDVSGKQGDTLWGLGAVIANTKGEILWEGDASIRLQHGSTDVLEATAVVEACRAAVEAVGQQVSVRLISAFCDNQGAAVALTHRKLTHRGGSLMDRVVSDLQALHARMPILMGWCPAQHDTQLQGVLAGLNKRADVRAKKARVSPGTREWTMPQSWMDGHSFAWYCKGIRVLGIKQMVRACMPHVGDSAPSEQGHVRMMHVHEQREEAQLRAVWVHCAFRHPREQAGALLAAFYENTREMYIDTEGEGECVVCGQRYECRIAHAHVQCPSLWRNVPVGLGEIAKLCVQHTRPGVKCAQVWGGIQLQGYGTTMLLMWMPPRHSAWVVQCMKQAHITLWPLYSASVPSVEVLETLKALSAEPARHVCMRIMNAQARHIWYTADPLVGAERQYWALPEAPGYAALMYADSRCHYAPGAGDEIVVPAPLLWGLLSTVWGLRAKLAAKGVWNMRLCSIQRADWRTHKRVGGPPSEGLQVVQPPEFGEEMCYVGITGGGLTPRQRWWYHRAEVHVRSITRVQGYQVVCLMRGPRAHEWGETVRQTLTRMA